MFVVAFCLFELTTHPPRSSSGKGVPVVKKKHRLYERRRRVITSLYDGRQTRVLAAELRVGS